MDGTELANAGDHAALNFLNTLSAPWGEEIELLASGRDFLGWLMTIDLLDGAERARLARKFRAQDLDDAAAEARGLREWLRGVVSAWAGTGVVPAGVARRLNRHLAADSQYRQLTTTEAGTELVTRRRWTEARQLLVLPVAAAADLLAHADRALVHMCDGPACGIWFYDRTKSHRRRWCSMAVCGNRDKVRNHRARGELRTAPAAVRPAR
ncbi:CGNR zinc finger domain-containing protein [Amycolatopsis rhabdoformis]|uniref:CGNR zinc finger domain-containing protein n=1 Tax=Amycolatopsis rhabdoformis TaxID=1448059 RepID=A0ABZ1IJS3_9PSEU|nr:CGNR zinc finger domain-containing protein [Amycolatopsis rhabdoformis]WSE34507.1 CGNR zinc finger domain-containing protein [Amycolatopsis rhabdoformis]